MLAPFGANNVDRLVTRQELDEKKTVTRTAKDGIAILLRRSAEQ